MINQDKLEITLQFARINQKRMQVQLVHHNMTMDIMPDQNNTAVARAYVDLPDHVMLKFFDKDLNCDTMLDENGNIVADLAVEITAISLAGFQIPKFKLPQLISLITENGQIIQTNYIGFNGSVKITMPERSIFSQIMSWKTGSSIPTNRSKIPFKTS